MILWEAVTRSKPFAGQNPFAISFQVGTKARPALLCSPSNCRLSLRVVYNSGDGNYHDDRLNACRACDWRFPRAVQAFGDS